jgi:hypothetical protein
LREKLLSIPSCYFLRISENHKNTLFSALKRLIPGPVA